MTKKPNASPAAVVVGAVLAVAVFVLVIKWALITIALLALPFAAWSLCDYVNRRETRRPTPH